MSSSPGPRRHARAGGVPAGDRGDRRSRTLADDELELRRAICQSSPRARHGLQSRDRRAITRHMTDPATLTALGALVTAIAGLARVIGRHWLRRR